MLDVSLVVFSEVPWSLRPASACEVHPTGRLQVVKEAEASLVALAEALESPTAFRSALPTTSRLKSLRETPCERRWDLAVRLRSGVN